MPALSRYTVQSKPLVQTLVPPVETRLRDDGTLFIDFGQAAFGTVLVPSSNARQGTIVVHLGEKLTNIIPRYLLGIRPLEPGFDKVLIRPQPGSLERVSGTMPTIRGPVTVSLGNNEMQPFELRIDIPVNVTAKVGLPARDRQSPALVLDGKRIEAEREGNVLFLDNIGSETHVLTYG